jgi:hypothetical protein
MVRRSTLGAALPALAFAVNALAAPEASFPDVAAEPRSPVPVTPTQEHQGAAQSHAEGPGSGAVPTPSPPAAPWTPSSSTRGQVDIGGRAGVTDAFGATPYKAYNGGALVGGEVLVHLSSAVRVGGFLESTWQLLPNGDGGSGSGPNFSETRFGARGQWHARPDRVVDPWLGLSLGAIHGGTCFCGEPTHSRWAMEIGGDVGLDFHLGRYLAVGPLLSIDTPLFDHPSPIPDWGGSVREPRFPTSLALFLPMLHVVITNLGS